MTEADAELVDRLAKRHSVSPAAVQVVLTALRSGGGRMARFSHAEFGGMSQWSPGMSMVGDMFNKHLQSSLDGLCTDIAAHLDASAKEDNGDKRNTVDVSYRSVSASRSWWPSGLGRPGAVGAQNDLLLRCLPRNPASSSRRHGTWLKCRKNVLCLIVINVPKLAVQDRSRQGRSHAVGQNDHPVLLEQSITYP